VIYNAGVRVVCVALFALATACGRIGFDTASSQNATLDDAAPDDSGTASGGGPPGDAVTDGAPAIQCTKPATGCGANEYCATPVGMCNAQGTCQAIPSPSSVCPDVVVCGCDGKAYPTPCAAARAFQSLQSFGACAI